MIVTLNVMGSQKAPPSTPRTISALGSGDKPFRPRKKAIKEMKELYEDMKKGLMLVFLLEEIRLKEKPEKLPPYSGPGGAEMKKIAQLNPLLAAVSPEHAGPRVLIKMVANTSTALETQDLMLY